MDARNFRRWIWRVFAWDTFLPMLIIGVPYVIELVLPKNQVALIIAAVAMPIAAFLLRLKSGHRQVAENHCSRIVCVMQWGAFYLGVVTLLFLDCMLITSHLMPPGAMLVNNTDRLVWASLIAVYLATMAVAMYPGRTIDATTERDDT